MRNLLTIRDESGESLWHAATTALLVALTIVVIGCIAVVLS